MIQSNKINSLINYSKINLNSIPIEDIIQIFNEKKHMFLAYKNHKLFFEKISTNNTIINLYLNEDCSFSLKPQNKIYRFLSEREKPFLRLIFLHNSDLNSEINLPEEENYGIVSILLYEYFTNEFTSDELPNKLKNYIFESINTQIYEYDLELLGKFSTSYFEKHLSLLELININEIIFVLPDVFLRRVSTNVFIRDYILYKLKIIELLEDKLYYRNSYNYIIEKNEDITNIVVKILDKLNSRDLDQDILSTKLYAFSILYSLKHNLISNELKSKILNIKNFINILYQESILSIEKFEQIFLENKIDLTGKLEFSVSVLHLNRKKLDFIPAQYINRKLFFNKHIYKKFKIQIFENIIKLLIDGSKITIDVTRQDPQEGPNITPEEFTKDLLEFVPVFSQLYSMKEQEFLNMISDKIDFYGEF